MKATLPICLYEEFLVCGLCKDSFDDPMLLPCLHTFCRKCLEVHAGRNNCTAPSLWFLCPYCRAITDIPPGGITNFRSNQFLVNLHSIVDVQTMKNRVNQQKCSAELLQNVSKENVLLRHRAKKEEEVGTSSMTCICRKQEVRFYCDECACLVCGDCMTAMHTHHRILLLEERASKDKDLFVSAVHDARTEISTLNDSINYLEKYSRHLQKAKNDTIEKVRGRANALRKLIDDEEKKMVESVERVFAGEKDKVNGTIKENSEVVSLLKNFKEFSEKLMCQCGPDEMVVWRRHVDRQLRHLAASATRSKINHIFRNPLDIRFTEVNMPVDSTIGRLMGEVKHGVNLDIIDNEALKIGERPPVTNIENTAVLNNAADQVIKSRIHSGKLLKSFSVFTDGSHYSPLAVDIASLPNADLLVVDRNNRCVKFFAESGGMYRKIHGGDTLYGVCVVDGDTIAIADKTIHMFDMKGRLSKVLRQQPRDSHGLVTNSNGDIVVTDCTSRCVYILTVTGGTIKRIITQVAGKTFKSPKYVTVNQNDDVIISDCGTNLVTIINERGQLINTFSGSAPGGGFGKPLNSPMGVCTDKLGNIIVCDKLNHRILLLDLRGNLLCTLVEGKENVKHPQAVCVDKKGNMVVAEEGGHIRVFKYREEE